jgi:hypothetical protein
VLFPCVRVQWRDRRETGGPRGTDGHGNWNNGVDTNQRADIMTRMKYIPRFESVVKHACAHLRHA